MYPFAITGSLVAAYFILYALFPYFFTGSFVKASKRSLVSVAIIILLSLGGYAVVLRISDLELGNRILHGFGGGFLTFLICFLAAKDTRVPVTKFQFFLMSALIVSGLGVANEILEFFLQNYGIMVFLRTTNDTWLDLLSNTVGILIAGIAFVPFI